MPVKGVRPMSLTALGPDQIARSLYRYDNVYRPLASPANLNEAHLRDYRENGFIAIEGVFSKEEVATYSQAITDLIAIGDPRIISFEEAAHDRTLTPEEREWF